MTKKQLDEVCEKQGWSVTIFKDYVQFENWSPCGQDLIVEINCDSLDELPDKMTEYWESYDPSQEAYYWLGSDGHGKNGAPDTMGEVYKDMVACEKMIEDLAIALHQIER